MTRKVHNHKFNDRWLARPLEFQLERLKFHLARMESGEDDRADLIDCVKYDIEQVEKQINERG